MNRKDMLFLAQKLNEVDVEAFSWLLDLQFTHADEAQEAKDVIVNALKDAAERKLK